MRASAKMVSCAEAIAASAASRAKMDEVTRMKSCVAECGALWGSVTAPTVTRKAENSSAGWRKVTSQRHRHELRTSEERPQQIADGFFLLITTLIEKCGGLRKLLGIGFATVSGKK